MPPLGRNLRQPIHYSVGSLIGGIYGFAAEFELRARKSGGAGFGIDAATMADEMIAPMARLADPFWQAPAKSHPYSYVSQVVYGMTTKAARKLLRRFLEKVRAGIATLS